MFVTPFRREYRKSVCTICPYLREDFKLFGITIFKRAKQCKVCKCSIHFKTMLEDAKCPKGKW